MPNECEWVQLAKSRDAPPFMGGEQESSSLSLTRLPFPREVPWTMFQTLARKVVFSLAALAACGGLVAAWRCGEEPTVVKLPAPLSHSSGTVVDHHFYAVTDSGRLLKVDLKSAKLTDLGAPADKLSPF